MPTPGISPAQAANSVKDRISRFLPADVGVILGTGLGGFAQAALQDTCKIEYRQIDGLPVSTVQSHEGALIAGTLRGRRVLVLSGRFHLYEGYTPAEVVCGVRMLALLGVPRLILTNAAGALNPQFDAGGLMLVTDHINHTAVSPLTGLNEEAWGPRFPDMSRVYDPDLATLALKAAAEQGLRLERGVYVQVPGPQLETPAETRMLRAMGADAVGMSTVMEAIAAAHMGLDMLAVSCLTNKNLPDCMQETTLEDVVAMAEQSGDALARLLSAVIAGLPEGS